MKNIRIFLSESFHFLVVKFSVYLNRIVFVMKYVLILVLLKQDIPCLSCVDPDQLASKPWSGSALFVIQYVNLYQQSGSSNLIG